MNKVIEITIRNKVARIASSPIIVGKNKDYIVRFNFDEDWDKYDTKTARFSQDEQYQDIIFAGDECSMPALDGGKVVEVGVYAGDISTTTPAYLKVQKSIIDDDGVPADPTPDVYAQLMERLNELEAPAAVLYTAQNLTDKQKAQARDNIGAAETGSGVDISLGIRGASAGQAPAVKSVDESGVPIEWEAVDFPSGALTVNLTMGGDGSITADKTFAEIKAAYDGGKMVTAKLELGCVPLISIGDSIAIFQVMAETNLLYFQCESQDGSDTWDFASVDMATVADARSLGMSGASVGQVPVVKSVDKNGVPNGWVARDLPSGGGNSYDIDLSRKPNLVIDVSEAINPSLSISVINGVSLDVTKMAVLLEYPSGGNYNPNYIRWNNIIKNAVDTTAILGNFNVASFTDANNAGALLAKIKKINNKTYECEYRWLRQNPGTVTGTANNVYSNIYRNNFDGNTSIKELYIYQAATIPAGSKISIWVGET